MKYTGNYAQSRRDFEALERIAELNDQIELDSKREELMQRPTKAHASDLYCFGIDLWFREHGISGATQKIADRYQIK